jgi:hypothetical protein
VAVLAVLSLFACETYPDPQWVICSEDACDPECRPERREQFCRAYPDKANCRMCFGVDASMNDATAPDSGTDDGSMPDGGDDGGPSAGRDSGSPDGGGERECSIACAMASASWCDTSKGECMACRTDQHCADLVAMPACVSGVGCFECSADNASRCEGTDKPLCKVGGNECVECNVTADCTDPTKSVCDNHVCVPCTASAECSHIAGKTVCDTDSQACVECLADERSACAGGANVCDMVGSERVCSDQAVSSASVCKPCVSDKQCQTGQVCTRMEWSDGESTEDMGWFCQWVQGGEGSAPVACNSSARPYVGEKTVASADDPSGSYNICTLRASTCAAILETFSDPCGRYKDNTDFIVEDRFDMRLPANTPASKIAPDDAICGPGGKCVMKNMGAGAYLCSVPCGSSNNDCPAGPFTCGGAPPGVSNICSI